jgi:hypothetical protein
MGSGCRLMGKGLDENGPWISHQRPCCRVRIVGGIRQVTKRMVDLPPKVERRTPHAFKATLDLSGVCLGPCGGQAGKQQSPWRRGEQGEELRQLPLSGRRKCSDRCVQPLQVRLQLSVALDWRVWQALVEHGPGHGTENCEAIIGKASFGDPGRQQCKPATRGCDECGNTDPDLQYSSPVHAIQRTGGWADFGTSFQCRIAFQNRNRA